MFATRHKEAFVDRIKEEIIQISRILLGLCVLAVYEWQRKNDLHFLLCSASQSLWQSLLLQLSLGQSAKHTECKWSFSLYDVTIMNNVVCGVILIFWESAHEGKKETDLKFSPSRSTPCASLDHY